MCEGYDRGTVLPELLAELPGLVVLLYPLHHPLLYLPHTHTPHHGVGHGLGTMAEYCLDGLQAGGWWLCIGGGWDVRGRGWGLWSGWDAGSRS